MGRIATYVNSSVGKKQLMAITGLLLSLFTLTHMAGNLLLLCGPETYNKYAHALTSNPAIYVAEAGLVFLFLVHLVCAIAVTNENRQARPQRYFVQPAGDKGGVSAAAKTMILTGLVLLVFTILHLITFKYGPSGPPDYEVTYDGVTMRDLYKLVAESFQNPGYVIWYLFSMAVLGLHLSHGISSTFQSLGINHPGFNKCLRCAGPALAWIIAIGFSVAPIVLYLKG